MQDRRNNSARYHRQALLPGMGEAGQRRLGESHVLIVGCGALGCAISDCLARAGVGALTIVDRDVVDLTSLHRQVLFDERDAAEAMPKAEAAKRRLAAINSEVVVHAVVDDFSPRNAEQLVAGADLILDGLDNFETRYLLNDLAVKRGLPYVYGGVVGTTGACVTILPHPARRTGEPTSRVAWSTGQATPCLRCVFPDPPPAGSAPSCDTAGVLGPAVAQIAAHQSAQAIKLATGNLDALDRSLLSLDIWSNLLRRIDVSDGRDAAGCPCCGEGRFEYLSGERGSAVVALCGQNAVQISPPDGPGELDLHAAAQRLEPHGDFTLTTFLLRGTLRGERGDDDQPVEITLFANGRAMIRGVEGAEAARSLYARYVGA